MAISIESLVTALKLFAWIARSIWFQNGKPVFRCIAFEVGEPSGGPQADTSDRFPTCCRL
jgi:hypothetical protein